MSFAIQKLGPLHFVHTGPYAHHKWISLGLALAPEATCPPQQIPLPRSFQWTLQVQEQSVHGMRRKVWKNRLTDFSCFSTTLDGRHFPNWHLIVFSLNLALNELCTINNRLMMLPVSNAAWRSANLTVAPLNPMKSSYGAFVAQCTSQGPPFHACVFLHTDNSSGESDERYHPIPEVRVETSWIREERIRGLK